MSFGYFLPAAVMVASEDSPAVPGLASWMTACSCRLDPARALAPALTTMPAAGTPPRATQPQQARPPAQPPRCSHWHGRLPVPSGVSDMAARLQPRRGQVAIYRAQRLPLG